MTVPFYVWVVTAVCCFCGSSAIYFTQERPTFCLPSDSKAGALVGRVFAYQNGRDRCMGEAIRYGVIEDSRHFTVNASGWIVLKTDILNSDVIELNISASCFTLECTELRNITTVTIDIHDDSDDMATANLTEERMQQMCFEGFPISLYVEENRKDISLGNLNNCANKDGYERMYTILKPKVRFTITTASELIVTKELDREALGKKDVHGTMDVSGKQSLKVSCELGKGSRLFPPQRRRLSVVVLDVNDNPPIFQQLNNTQHEEVDIQHEKVEIDLERDKTNSIVPKVVLDMDTNNSTYQLKVTKDPLKICKAAITFLSAHGKSVGDFTIDFQNLNLITQSQYRCQVDLVDTEFEPYTPTSYSNKVTITVNFHRPSQKNAPTAQSIKAAKQLNFYRNATRLARLLKISDDPSEVAATYTLENDIFKVTNRTGIVYVDDVEALAVAVDSISLFIVKPKGDGINLVVNMLGAPRSEDCYDDMCSWHRSADSCTGSCGVGLLRGGCLMRGSQTKTGMSRNYGTCTHDPVTCPDGECDELEDKFPMLCPQDCTTKIIGPGKLNDSQSPGGRGVLEAINPFWCEDDGWNCFSGFKLFAPARQLSSVTAKRSSVECPPVTTPTTMSVYRNTTLYNITDQSRMVAPVTEETTPTCNKACGTAIGLGIGALVAISFSLFMLWFTKRRNDRRKNNLKHVGSVVSMSAVPSDYVEDRERQMSYSSPSWSPKGPINPSQIQSLYYEHGKWEVPRENLTLDKTIGEGEFGLVVKANAVGIGGDNRPRDVAVKMLKHCSTQLEEQDLWSEFTLLTDVSHPNVIRLLGACTGDGPFYVIVEYCEHGCLLKYLRRSRLVENGYINTRMRYRSPNVNEQTDPDKEGDLLDLRDLLSFAWQIAKGMGYLSEIKLVHRDLAARNVLVAEGKVLKISDFGLTRDVYEADTYLKRSRGRIPVKWLAPESLFAQIYTTRSDVWSYGIVLWEIVTLGAPPYPGIPPERLYNLLMGGYRMDKPEFCPDEMYAVMQKCWKIDAADRPSFACLANIFDRILQEKTGYLDLSQGCSNVRDLYSKCFDSSGVADNTRNTTNTSTSHDTHAEVHQPAEDLVDNINLKTVSNELYNQDTYLTPTVTATEDDNKSVPLLGDQKDTSTDDTSVPNVEQTDSKTEKDMPLFIKKMIDNKSPGHSRSTGNKNKNVIYPSEKLSLLMENGSAKFSNNLHDMEDSLRIELD